MKERISYVGNIESLTEENDYFRKVIFTGEKSQLVIMSLDVGEQIGEEIHENIEQTLYIKKGKCTAFLNGEIHHLSEGDIVVVIPGIRHNFINSGDVPVKIITIYSPPNHIEGRVHRTKEEADKDNEDEAYGHAT